MWKGLISGNFLGVSEVQKFVKYTFIYVIYVKFLKFIKFLKLLLLLKVDFKVKKQRLAICIVHLC